LKFIDLQKRRAELRDIERDIAFARRELVPLTTGVIGDVKRRRTEALRHRVHLRRDSATKIQALMRRTRVRIALYDPYKEYWVRGIDRDLSDEPYYYNVQTFETVWVKPMAYHFFGDRFADQVPLLIK
jgi:hypothetical protein